MGWWGGGNRPEGADASITGTTACARDGVGIRGCGVGEEGAPEGEWKAGVILMPSSTALYKNTLSPPVK